MNWYILFTPRGWAAILGEKRTIINSVLPTPSPLTALCQYIKQTGFDSRFITLYDYSIPFVNKFRSYYEGSIITDWDVELKLDGFSQFTRKVLEFVYTIPYGETRTYAQVARVIGNPKAARAVGQVMKHNPLPLIIPCHRVVASAGPGGFNAPGGVETKLKMLQWEKETLLKQNHYIP
ncbi:MAG: methylated-DNA--[protein]-cysteine S-methyltransferase [Syntrophomonadaceae bacterium]|jgi:methylated-DNA-[protein]-cysteine S-methyltransferase